MSEFYLCGYYKCNSKYKTPRKWTNHVIKKHNAVDPVLPTPTIINKSDKQRSNRRYMSNREDECIICMDKPPTHAIVPCGHAQFCGTCLKLELLVCPMCKGQIDSILKIYK